MEYTQPVIYRLDAFDKNGIIPTLRIAFAGLVEEPLNMISGKLSIYENDTGLELTTAVNIDSTKLEDGASKELAIYDFNIPTEFISSILNGGVYYFTFQVTGNNESPLSNGSLFYCYTKPYFYNNEDTQNLQVPSILNQASYKFNFKYSQKEGYLLNWYKCELYNSANTLIYSTNELYDTNYSIIIPNLQNETLYKIKLIGDTIEGFLFENNTNTFEVKFEENENSSYLNIINDCNEGCIKINSTFNSIPGELNNSYLHNGEVDLKKENQNIIWNKELNINENLLTIKLWGKDFNNDNILELSDDRNKNNNLIINGKIGNIGNMVSKDNILLDGNPLGNNKLINSLSFKLNNGNYIYFSLILDEISTNKFAYSEDLINWFTEKYNNNDIRIEGIYKYICYRNNIFYIADIENNYIYYSTNGKDWVSVDYSNLLDFPANAYITSIVNNNEYIYFYGNNCSFRAKNNFLNDLEVIENNNKISTVFYFKNKFIGIISNTFDETQGFVYYSNDGLTWNKCYYRDGRIMKLNYIDYHIPIISINNKVIIYHYKDEKQNSFYAYYSNDGMVFEQKEINMYPISWTYKGYSATLLFKENMILNIFNGNNNIPKGVVQYSIDGLNWNNLFDIEFNEYNNPVGIVNDKLLISANTLKEYSLSYDTIQFVIKVLNKDGIAFTKESNVLNNIPFDNYVYIGSQIEFNQTNEDLVDNGDILIADKGKNI